MTAATIDRWTKEGMPQRKGAKGTDITVDTWEAISWYCEREKAKELAALRSRFGLNNGNARGTKSEEELRLLAAKRELAELEAQKMGGTMGLIEDFQQSANEAMIIIASQDDAIAGRLALELAAESNPAAIRVTLLAALRENRDAAAARLEHWAGGNLKKPFIQTC